MVPWTKRAYAPLDLASIASSEQEYIAALEKTTLRFPDRVYPNGAKRIHCQHQDPANWSRLIVFEAYQGLQRTDTGEVMSVYILSDNPKGIHVVQPDDYETWYSRWVGQWHGRPYAWWRHLDWWYDEELLIRERSTNIFLWIHTGQAIPVSPVWGGGGRLMFFKAPDDYDDPSQPYRLER